MSPFCWSVGGGFHEREAEFGVVLSTTKLLGEPVGAVKQKPKNYRLSFKKITDQADHVSYAMSFFMYYIHHHTKAYI